MRVASRRETDVLFAQGDFNVVIIVCGGFARTARVCDVGGIDGDPETTGLSAGTVAIGAGGGGGR